MKATVDTKVRTLVDVTHPLHKRPIPAGTEGFVIEAYTEPREGYDVEVKLAEDDFEVLTLRPDEFEPVESPA